MGDPEITPVPAPAVEPAPPEPTLPEPTLSGVPIGKRKPEATPKPLTDPDITELQDRRRPRP